MRRPRPFYALWILSTIATGLFLRSSFSPFPFFINKYGGDTLWALLFFIGFGFLFPKLPTLKTAALALLITCATEASQLYQAPWIDHLRQTRVGGLLLGSHFHWPDFIAYAVGIGIGFGIEWWAYSPKSHKSPVN